jgi:hypothetical protein
MKTLDGRHKLAVVGALVCWCLSVWFSYLGFRIDADKIAFVGWVMAGVVTIVELVFNSQTGKLSLTLVVTGILCYAYGIWTNVIGFWDLQHPGVEFIILSQRSIMPAFVGIIMEVLPEPLLMWGLMSKMDGDFLGNMVGLWNGRLSYAEPPQTQENTSNQRAPQYEQTAQRFQSIPKNNRHEQTRDESYQPLADTSHFNKPKPKQRPYSI